MKNLAEIFNFHLTKLFSDIKFALPILKIVLWIRLSL